jgi:hypothetical protein
MKVYSALPTLPLWNGIETVVVVKGTSSEQKVFDNWLSSVTDCLQ